MATNVVRAPQWMDEAQSLGSIGMDLAQNLSLARGHSAADGEFISAFSTQGRVGQAIGDIKTLHSESDAEDDEDHKRKRDAGDGAADDDDDDAKKKKTQQKSKDDWYSQREELIGDAVKVFAFLTSLEISGRSFQHP